MPGDATRALTSPGRSIAGGAATVGSTEETAMAESWE